MDITLLTEEYGAVEVDSSNIRRLSSPGSARITIVTLADGASASVPDYPMAILKQAGLDKDGPFIDVDVVGDSGSEYLHGDWITVLRKVQEEDDNDDPTRLDLADGQYLVVTESIRTLQARLGQKGFKFIDIDLVGTSRPAALRLASIVKLGLSMDQESDAEIFFELEGGVKIAVRLNDEWDIATIVNMTSGVSRVSLPKKAET